MVNRTLIPFLAALLLSACNTLTPYKLDIPQGNEITADQVAQLKPGMSRTQVRFLLGTPLLEDPFHANRWDYIVSRAKGGALIEKKTFTVYFDGETVTHWTGDTLPARQQGDGTRSSMDAVPITEPSTATQPPIETHPLTE